MCECLNEKRKIRFAYSADFRHCYVNVWEPHLVSQMEADHGWGGGPGLMPLPGMGSFSMLVDPTGAAFALWEPEMPA